MRSNFSNSEEAFEYLYNEINFLGNTDLKTKYLNNVGFTIHNPTNNKITTPWRKWSEKYAAREYNWYLSENRNVKKLAKYARIWNTMHGGDFIVNSNYGYQWNRNDQLSKVCEMILNDKQTRRACLTLYDGKEIDIYTHDTPCTLNVCFQAKRDQLDMTVVMRSCDLWYGFCNDQYCFSSLQLDLSKRLGMSVGTYFHFCVDLHLYFDKLNKC